MVIPFSRGNAWEQLPPDLASHFYRNRIVYLGMSLVPSVTELQVNEEKAQQYAYQIEAEALERRFVLKDFSRTLDNQIEKIVLFMLEQQGLLASRIGQLNEQQEALQEQPDISKVSELRAAYRGVGQDLLKLLFFVEMNKLFGYQFTDYYVKTRANQCCQRIFKQLCY